jgi:hypothetical protein
MNTVLIAKICAGIAVVLTPIYLVMIFKGVRSLSDIRDLLRRPPGDPR